MRPCVMHFVELNQLYTTDKGNCEVTGDMAFYCILSRVQQGLYSRI